MVIFCGMAATYLQLLVARIGVAIGEAGCVPPAQSLIGDYYSRLERSQAMSCYQLGGPLSMIVGCAVAGWINQWYGWRMEFFVVGAPGIVLALLVRFSLREPRLEKKQIGDELAKHSTGCGLSVCVRNALAPVGLSAPVDRFYLLLSLYLRSRAMDARISDPHAPYRHWGARALVRVYLGSGGRNRNIPWWLSGKSLCRYQRAAYSSKSWLLCYSVLFRFFSAFSCRRTSTWRLPL